MPRPLRNGKRTAEIGGGVLKCLQDGSLRMPLFFWREIATGKSALGRLGTRDHLKIPSQQLQPRLLHIQHKPRQDLQRQSRSSESIRGLERKKIVIKSDPYKRL